MRSMTQGGNVPKLQMRRVISALLARKTSASEIPLHVDCSRRGVGKVVLVLSLVLEPRFIHNVVVDDKRIA